MPRQLRIEYPGAIYPVMNRGDRRKPIYQDDADRIRFLQTLGEACGKTDWQIYARGLMGNHFHVVFEPPGDNLVATPKVCQSRNGEADLPANRHHRLRRPRRLRAVFSATGLWRAIFPKKTCCG